MANDERDAQHKGPNEPVPGKGGGTPPPPSARSAKESFLPEDSFLFEMDDVAARGPRPVEPVAPVAPGDVSDEWILVEDDALDEIAEPIAAAPERTPALERARDVEPDDETGDPLDTMEAMAQELAPVAGDAVTDENEERSDERVDERLHAPVDERLRAPVDDAAEPDRSDATDTESEPLAPIAGLPAARKGVPSWLTDDENELPSFVADDSEGEAPAAASSPTPALVHAAATSTGDVAPASEASEEESEAPVLAMKRSRRSSWLAAAGVLVGLGLTLGGLYWWRQQEAAAPVDVALNPPPTKHAPTPKPADPVAVTPEPVATLPVPADVTRTEEVPLPAPVAVSPPAVPAVVEAPAPVVPETVVSAPPKPADPITRMPVPAVAAAPVDLAPSARIVDATAPIRPAGISATTQAPMDAAGLLARHGETIVELKNGHQFRGRVKRIKEGNITLGFSGGEFTFPLSDVEVLDIEAPEYRPLEQLPLASIVLHTGQRMRGRLLRETPEHVVLAFENGQLTVQRSEIKDVSFTGRIHF